MKNILLFGALFSLVITTYSAAAETLFEATYEGEYANLSITMVRSLESNGKNFTLNAKAKSFMARIDEQSQFSREGQSLKPSHYSYERKIFGVSKQEYLDFDWASQTAVYRKGDEKRSEKKLTPLTLDPTLYQLQLQLDLTQNPNKPSYSYTFARRNQIKTYVFKPEGETTMTVDGKAHAVKIFTRAHEKDTTTHIWLVPDFDYAIGKIIHTEKDGSSYQVLLTSYKSHPSFKQFLSSTKP